MTSAGFNRRMRKTACPVVWKEHGAKSPCSHPIKRCGYSSFEFSLIYTNRNGEISVD